MAHQEQRNFIIKLKSIYPSFFKNKKVLEVGSLNINGTIRDFFTDCQYLGLDVGEGLDVDIVCPGQDYNAPDKTFDVVCSVECFEHNPYWLETFLNMIRMCKNDGLVFFTCASTGRMEHGTSRTAPEASPYTVEWDYYKNLVEEDFTSKLNFSDIFSEHYFDYNPHSYDLYFYGIKKQNKCMKKIVDCFPFFNEKELLELRLNLLDNYVDEFIISELNYTHSGNKKDFICKNIVDELGFSDRVTVLEVEVDDELTPNEIDIYNSQESKSSKESIAWTRERIQRDALLEVIDKYSDDTVFILGDCDEIINPKFIDYFSNVCRNNKENIIKIPLVLLEGRCDKRLFMNNEFVPWMNSLLMCTSNQLKNGGTPTKMRSNVMNKYPPVWITESNQVLQDCGWHFTWMGDLNRKLEKASSFIHYANLNSINTLSSKSIEQVFSRIPDQNSFRDMNLDEKNNYEQRNYPIELLPKIIFDLPRVKNFLLPEEKNFHFSTITNTRSTSWIVDNFYENPDEVRKFALEQEYDIGGIGRGYIGNRTHQQFLFPGLKEKFEDIIGQKITKWEEHGMNGRFQYCWSGQPLVYHCDNQKWGGMLYLTPDAPYQCGTTLYAHKQTRARTYYDEGWDAAWTNIPGDSHLDGTPFEPVDVLGNVYNRLVIFDASCIHSASQYFGTVKENCRLWQQFFFDTD